MMPSKTAGYYLHILSALSDIHSHAQQRTVAQLFC